MLGVAKNKFSGYKFSITKTSWNVNTPKFYLRKDQNWNSELAALYKNLLVQLCSLPRISYSDGVDKFDQVIALKKN